MFTDGKTVYFAARGVVWSIPSSAASGDEASKVHTGDSIAMDPSGHRLIVQSQDSLQLRRFSAPLDGGPEREIPVDATVTSAPIQISLKAINPDGRLLVSLLLRDSWFNPPGVVDTASGRVARIPSENLSDYQSIGWTPDGHIIDIKIGLRATMWKFKTMPR